METKDWLTVFAVLLSPLIALQVQQRLDELKERRRWKRWIFNTLMSTRADRVGRDHVNALNRIDLEFIGDRRVTSAWKSYFDHLNHRDTTLEAWVERSDDLFVELLAAMSASLKYSFDKVDLKRGVYSPQAHGQDAEDNLVIRQALVAIAKGERGLKVDLSAVTTTDEERAEADEDTQAVKEVFKGARPLLIKVVTSEGDHEPARAAHVVRTEGNGSTQGAGGQAAEGRAAAGPAGPSGSVT